MTKKTKPTLAEVFPVDPVPKDHVPKLQAIGDSAHAVEVTEKDLKAEAKAKKAEAKAKKAAKKLRKEQRNGYFTWVTDKTKTIVDLRMKKPSEHTLPRWFIKYSDGTEEWSNFVIVMYSRDNADHHIRVGHLVGHYDKLSNKQYEALLKSARDHAAKEQRSYTNLYKSFMSSNGVQKELEKPITKKEEKQDPLGPGEMGLADRLANLAKQLEVSPIIFSKLPKYIKLLGKDPTKFELDRYGIDESMVTIRILKEAVKLHRKMEPLIDGVPLSQVDKPKEKETKPTKKKRVLFDQFGDLIDSDQGKINAALVKLSGSHKAVVTTEMVQQECGLECKKHLKSLYFQDYILKTEKGWKLK